jgi:GntR family transcriptional regulator
MALMTFHLDPASGVSYYVQLMQQVRQAVMFGVLRPGDRLPTVKEVVSQVALNPNTVLRAYRDLEHEGVVVSKPGLGTFVTAGAPPSIPPPRYRALRSDLEKWIAKARMHGLDDEAVASLFAHVLRANAREGAA